MWNSQGVVYKGSNGPNRNWTKQCNQQLKEIHFSLLVTILCPWAGKAICTFSISEKPSICICFSIGTRSLHPLSSWIAGNFQVYDCISHLATWYWLEAISGLLLLVLSLAPRGLSPGSPVFPSPQKPTFPNSNSTRNQVDEEPLCGCATCKSLFLFFFSLVLLRE